MPSNSTLLGSHAGAHNDGVCQTSGQRDKRGSRPPWNATYRLVDVLSCTLGAPVILVYLKHICDNILTPLYESLIADYQPELSNLSFRQLVAAIMVVNAEEEMLDLMTA